MNDRPTSLEDLFWTNVGFYILAGAMLRKSCDMTLAMMDPSRQVEMWYRFLPPDHALPLKVPITQVGVHKLAA